MIDGAFVALGATGTGGGTTSSSGSAPASASVGVVPSSSPSSVIVNIGPGTEAAKEAGVRETVENLRRAGWPVSIGG